MRLDIYVQQKFQLKSRTYAENLVRTGGVSVDGKVVKKPSFCVTEDSKVEISSDEGYASQGAYKLEEAFRVFPISVENKRTADIGCSNGGFTDCMLRRGAKSVLAIDISECALDERLLESGKVTFLRANARALPELERVEFCCSDVSFISLTLVLPEIYKLLEEEGEAVVLIKPQFELDRSALSKSGIVKEEKLRKMAVDRVVNAAIGVGFTVKGIEQSPIRYEQKNIEYLLWIKK